MITQLGCAKLVFVKNHNLMSVNDAAEFLNVHRITLHRWTREGRFAVTRIGRKHYLNAGDIQAFKADTEAIELRKANELINIREAATYLGIHLMTLYRWIKEKKLHPDIVGWQMYLTIEEVESMKALLDSEITETPNDIKREN